MIDPTLPRFCLGNCGRYTDLIHQAAKPREERWHPEGAGLRCPDCVRHAARAKVRAALQNGIRISTRDLSEAQREAAREVLGAELLEAVDEGWDG